jgi:hypothetical protein
MQDLCLLFKDEAESLSILFTIIPPEYELGKNGKPTKVIKSESYLQQNYQNISIIGKMFKIPLGPITDDYVPETYPSPNYGVNIRLMEDEGIEPLKPYIVEPKNPIRVWA